MATRACGRLSSGVDPPLPPSSLDYLARARVTLTEAASASSPAQRYAAAHVAALQAAAALLAARTRPTRRRGQPSAWVLLVQVAPELAEWAGFFAAGAGKRAAAEAEIPGAVTAREADDLLRDSLHFLALVERAVRVGEQRAG